MKVNAIRNRIWAVGRPAMAGFFALAALAATPPRDDPTPDKLPFFAGEELTYRMRVGGLGTVAMGKMTVSGPTTVRGTSVLLLTSEFKSTVALVGGGDRTRSWIEHANMRVLRYEKSEKTPFSRREELVNVFPAEKRWVAENGRSGSSLTDASLDELSFIYFIRTLPLEKGDSYRFDRHYEAGRNPVVIRVLGRETIEVGAGTFDAVVVEMRVRDPSRHEGEAVLRIHMTDTDCRIPLRIESEMPKLGRTVMTLEAHTHPASHLVAR